MFDWYNKKSIMKESGNSVKKKKQFQRNKFFTELQAPEWQILHIK